MEENIKLKESIIYFNKCLDKSSHEHLYISGNPSLEESIITVLEFIKNKK